MKKIAIVTITDYLNIGNRLQNLAVQYVLKKRYNCKIKTIQNFGANLGFKHNCSKSFFLKQKLKYYIKVCLGLIKSKYRIFTKFYKFNRNIKISNFYFYKKTNYRKLDNSFDYFITGSDQVWNPVFFEECLYNNFLMFTSKEKKITFAPSVSVDYVPDKVEEEFKKNINTFNRIFIREKTTLPLVKKYTKNHVDWVFDPTLFLSKEEWLKFSNKKLNKEKFILCYFLGEILNEMQKEIKLFAKNRNLDIINVNNLSNDKNTKFSPDEFISLINKADYVFTDSFHGAVFSFIFEKKFIIYNRLGKINLNSRIDSLVQELEIDFVKRQSCLRIEDIDKVEYNFSKGKINLEQNKQRYFRYLDSLILKK